MNTTTVYAEIVKAERNEAGDLVVVGKATGPDLDLDHQICDPEWLGKAMPKWFSTGANIREMHQGIAAGVGTELEQSGDSWMVTSTVIDASSAKKVEAGVLKGYSIGISNPKVIKDKAAPGGRIVDGSIVEVSLVDRPCNPTAMLMLSKAAKPGMQVKASQLDHDRMLVKVEEFVEIPEQAEPVEPVEPEPVEPAPVDELVTIPPSAEPDAPKTSEPAVAKTTDTDIEDRLTKLEKRFTEALTAAEDRTKAVEAELAKVKALPAPGGPVLTRTAQDTQKAAMKDGLLTKVAKYRQMADAVDDPRARQGYLELAAALELQLS
jgi:hypothetical protein